LITLGGSFKCAVEAVSDDTWQLGIFKERYVVYKFPGWIRLLWAHVSIAETFEYSFKIGNRDLVCELDILLVLTVLDKDKISRINGWE
jgi:hypothetical protein